jgi:hypothetical protein
MLHIDRVACTGHAGLRHSNEPDSLKVRQIWGPNVREALFTFAFSGEAICGGTKVIDAKVAVRS